MCVCVCPCVCSQPRRVAVVSEGFRTGTGHNLYKSVVRVRVCVCVQSNPVRARRRCLRRGRQQQRLGDAAHRDNHSLMRRPNYITCARARGEHPPECMHAYAPTHFSASYFRLRVCSVGNNAKLITRSCTAARTCRSCTWRPRPTDPLICMRRIVCGLRLC